MIVTDNDRRSKNKNGRYTLNSYRIFLFNSTSTTPELTRPCEQGNWDTWMVLDPWNQV